MMFDHPQGGPWLPTSTGTYLPADPKYMCRYLIPKEDLSGPYTPIEETAAKESGLDSLLQHRKELLHQKIGLLTVEIFRRYALEKDNLYGIDKDQCTFRSLIWQIGDHYFDRRRIELERRIVDLEQEKRREKANTFRDVLFLKKELRETLLETIEERQKEAYFTGIPEEPT